MKKNTGFNERSICIIALAATGEGISGGDRIFIEFAKRWRKKLLVKIVVTEEGLHMCRNQGLFSAKGVEFEVLSAKKWKKFGFVIHYLVRIFLAIRWAFGVNAKQFNLVYSASEFWMDSFPGWILKFKKTAIKWIACWYQTAPNPLQGYSYNEQPRHRFRALVYWLIQQPVKPLINNWADLVLVNNKAEQSIFENLDRHNKTMVVLGAVNTFEIERARKQFSQETKKIEAVFQGRFHPQKGVLEMVDIWAKVVKKIPRARLVMIGDGPLKKLVEDKIYQLKLTKNISLPGYLFDGIEKYRLFAQSKLVVHPSLYDSGGMASAEAMAFDMPVIGFDLKAYQDYYPVGMEKIKIGDQAMFAHKIIDLLKNPALRRKKGQKTGKYIRQNWSWGERSEQVLDRIIKL